MLNSLWIKARTGEMARAVRFRARQAYYLTPNVFARSPPITSPFDVYLRELHANGVVGIPRHFAGVAERVRDSYLPALEQFEADGAEVHHEHVLSVTATPKIDRPYVAKLSFADTAMDELYFSSDLAAMVHRYLRRQPYHRNCPVIVKSAFSGRNPEHAQGRFHMDGGIHQISFMLLLNDLTEDDTHMVYAAGSNREWIRASHINDRKSVPQDQVARSYTMVPLVGEAGTLWVFDAGNGFHRAVYRTGTVRVLLHMNLTAGSHIGVEPDETHEGWERLEEHPRHVARLMERLLRRRRA